MEYCSLGRLRGSVCGWDLPLVSVAGGCILLFAAKGKLLQHLPVDGLSLVYSVHRPKSLNGMSVRGFVEVKLTNAAPYT